MKFLENGLKKFGYLNDNDTISVEWLKAELKERFETINFNEALKDVVPFINNNDRYVSGFNKDIFIGTIDLIEVE